MRPNLCGISKSVLSADTLAWYKYLIAATDDLGLDQPVYADKIYIKANVQNLDREMVQSRGFDLEKNYITIFVEEYLVGIGRDVAGDIVIYKGKQYKCLAVNDWHSQNGWVQVNAVLAENIIDVSE